MKKIGKWGWRLTVQINAAWPYWTPRLRRDAEGGVHFYWLGAHLYVLVQPWN